MVLGPSIRVYFNSFAMTGSACQEGEITEAFTHPWNLESVELSKK